jgi:hypothetical protein
MNGADLKTPRALAVGVRQGSLYLEKFFNKSKNNFFWCYLLFRNLMHGDLF